MSCVWELVEETKDRGQHANIFPYNSLLDCLCKNNNVNRAIALFKKTKDHGI